MRKFTVVLLVAMSIMTIALGTGSCTDKKPVAVKDSMTLDSAQIDSVLDDSAESIIAETPMPKAADELFDDFVFNFAANKKLQFKRIHFPLPVYRNGKVAKYITQRRWKMEHFFMRQDFYTLIFDNHKQMNLVKDTTVSHAVIEKIYLQEKLVKQYLFNRVNGKWQMTSINYKSMHENQNSSFLNFYSSFATDTAFQRQHLHTPVKFSGPDPDDDFETMTGDIAPETWPAFAPPLPSGMIYNIIYGQKYRESNQKLFVVRGIANGLETELTFKRVKGKWLLTQLNT